MTRRQFLAALLITPVATEIPLSFFDGDLDDKIADLSDEIFHISPMDTPFLSVLTETRTGSVLHDWTEDDLFAR